MDELKFQNPIFSWMNITVRRGVRQLNGTVKLMDPRGYPRFLGYGFVLKYKIKRFKDIEDKDLELEHDPKCRTYVGLLETMREVYDDFDVNEIVTLIQFEVPSQKIIMEG